METLLIIFAVQGLLGAYDTIYHHEITERLPWRKTAATELKLHGIRNLFYTVIFLSLAWISWNGILAWIFASMLFIEILITLMDFVEEDQTRKLPATERITHTILTLNYGVILALLIPILWNWSQQPTGFAFINNGILSWIMTLYALGVFIWGWRELLRGIWWSSKTETKTLSISPLNKPHQNILVTGGTGFIGRPLCQALIDQGHNLIILTRSMENAALFNGRVTLVNSLNHLNKNDNIDVVINLAGEPIVQRWTKSNQARMLESRINTTKQLIEFMKRLPNKPSVFISSSAIGIYGTDNATTFTEDSDYSDDPTGAFPKQICEQWEAEALKAEDLGIRTCLLRTGIVLETGGGALAQMLFPFELGLGGPMGSGRQWLSWIHRDDLLHLIVHLINSETINGPVNATAPHPVTNKAFAKSLGKAMTRPAILPLPSFQVKLLFGEMGKTVLLAGQKVLPQKAVNNNFQFTYPELDQALQQIFSVK